MERPLLSYPSSLHHSMFLILLYTSILFSLSGHSTLPSLRFHLFIPFSTLPTRPSYLDNFKNIDILCVVSCRLFPSVFIVSLLQLFQFYFYLMLTNVLHYVGQKIRLFLLCIIIFIVYHNFFFKISNFFFFSHET